MKLEVRKKLHRWLAVVHLHSILLRPREYSVVDIEVDRWSNLDQVNQLEERRTSDPPRLELDPSSFDYLLFKLRAKPATVRPSRLTDQLLTTTVGEIDGQHGRSMA